VPKSQDQPEYQLSHRKTKLHTVWRGGEERAENALALDLQSLKWETTFGGQGKNLKKKWENNPRSGEWWRDRGTGRRETSCSWPGIWLIQ